MSKKSMCMREYEKDDVRLAGFFLDELLTQFRPHFSNQLTVCFDFRINLNCRHEIVMAIVELVPNQNFSETHNYSFEEIITLEKRRHDGCYLLNFEHRIDKSSNLRSILEKTVKSYQAIEELSFYCLSFRNLPSRQY